MVSIALGCAIPGRLYPVAPAISGRVHGGELPTVDGQLTLHVVHSESADLYAREQVRLSPDGHFAFEAPELVVAGHEYSKRYGAFLHIRAGEQDRVIWRAQFSRLALTATPVLLDCDLARPVQHGQPCWVNDPLQYPWLVSQGERTFRRLCASCHGTDGAGVIGSVEPPGSKPPDLRMIAARRGGRFDRAEIAEWIEGRSLPDAHGTRRMPIWGERLAIKYERYADSEGLIGATLDPLVSYLESLQRTE
jgi:hypothetical protein